MKTLKGEVSIGGNVALVTQQAWIFNGTVRENILFNAEFSKAKYEIVLNACSLEQDLEVMPNGDLTEIGERGMNLSGGNSLT